VLNWLIVLLKHLSREKAVFYWQGIKKAHPVNQMSF
jgi:hypothetical protein